MDVGSESGMTGSRCPCYVGYTSHRYQIDDPLKRREGPEKK